MSLTDAIRVLVLGEGRQFPVISTRGLRLLFNDDDDHAFNRGVRKLIDVGLLERVGRSVYLNRALPDLGLEGVGVIARHLRPRHLCYLSYESALAEFGSISQVPLVYLVATTGNGGEYATRYGDLEFSHTRRGDVEILRNTVFDDRIGLRIASPELAYDDLRRVRPGNLHLVDDEMHTEVLADWHLPVPGASHA